LIHKVLILLEICFLSKLPVAVLAINGSLRPSQKTSGIITQTSASLCDRRNRADRGVVVPTAIIKSFERDEGLVVVRVDETSPEVSLRVCGSDRSTVAKLGPGKRIRFAVARDRRGCAVAIDVTSAQPLNRDVA
jgi:hypothetical protein